MAENGRSLTNVILYPWKLILLFLTSLLSLILRDSRGMFAETTTNLAKIEAKKVANVGLLSIFLTINYRLCS